MSREAANRPRERFTSAVATTRASSLRTARGQAIGQTISVTGGPSPGVVRYRSRGIETGV